MKKDLKYLSPLSASFLLRELPFQLLQWHSRTSRGLEELTKRRKVCSIKIMGGRQMEECLPAGHTSHISQAQKNPILKGTEAITIWSSQPARNYALGFSSASFHYCWEISPYNSTWLRSYLLSEDVLTIPAPSDYSHHWILVGLLQ